MLRRSWFYHSYDTSSSLVTVNRSRQDTIVHTFISTRLDYCNSLVFGVSVGFLWEVQSVQNAAVRLATGARRRDHITPVLNQLHWLPVRQRVEFQITCLVHQSLYGPTPAYLAVDIQLDWTFSRCTLCVEQFACRLATRDTFSTFKRHLKTILTSR